MFLNKNFFASQKNTLLTAGSCVISDRECQHWRIIQFFPWYQSNSMSESIAIFSKMHSTQRIHSYILVLNVSNRSILLANG